MDAVLTRLGESPVVAILGARQVGKTTLARRVVERVGESVTWFDLEDPADLARLADPGVALRGLRGLVVLDEVQRSPDLFPLLRVLADRDPLPARFLLLGSASPELLRQGSETLAGRLSLHRLDGFHLDEVGAERADDLWIRGGFPRSFLAADDAASLRWRADFVTTFLERDLPQLGVGVPAPTMRRLWTMLAHLHGQTLNASELSRSLGVSDTTVRRYVDHLAAALVVRVLPPWHANVGKRQVKAPKVYVADSGLLHALLQLADRVQVERHPKLGASWEGFALAEVVRALGIPWDRCSFWATHQGAEMDLVVEVGGRRLGVEAKRTDAPGVTRSMHVALADLELDEILVVHGGAASFPMADRIRALALRDVLSLGGTP